MPSPLRLKDRTFYGWVVVGAFFIISATIMGVRYSFGVFFKSLASEFDLTRTATSMIWSVYMIAGTVFIILGGWALDRYGPRIVVLVMGIFCGLSLLLTSQVGSLWQLFVSYSLLLAVGTSAQYVVLMSTVSRWFDKKRGLALGIASAGGGVGAVVMAPSATFLIAGFGWRTAYIAMGVISWLLLVPLGRLLKRDPYEIGALPDGAKAVSAGISREKPESGESIHPAGLSLSQAVRTRSFWLITAFFLCFGSALFLVVTHLVNHVTDIGFSAVQAATVLSMTSGMAIPGRVAIGLVSDRVGKKSTAIVCFSVQVGALIWLIWAQELWMLYLFGIVFGLAYSGIPVASAGLVSQTFGLRKMGTILGVLDVGFALGAAIGPAIGGYIFDVRNSYSLAFVYCAAIILLASMLIALVRREMSAEISSA